MPARPEWQTKKFSFRFKVKNRLQFSVCAAVSAECSFLRSSSCSGPPPYRPLALASDAEGATGQPYEFSHRAKK
jgi:hypothetical protein